MRTRTTMNMTEGRPLALLTVFALPLLIGNLFQQAIGTIMSIAMKKPRNTEIDEVFRRVVMVHTIKHLKMDGLMIIHGLKK